MEHPCGIVRGISRNVSSRRLLLRGFPLARKKWKDALFLTSDGQKVAEIRHRRHQSGEGRGQPCLCVPVARARQAAGSVLDVAHGASEFPSEPFPRKPRIWFWSDTEEKKDGQMISRPDSLIFSDSLCWGMGQIKNRGHWWQILWHVQRRDCYFPELPVICILFVPLVYTASLLSGWPLRSGLSEAEVSAWRLLAPKWYLVTGWEKGKLQMQPLEILLLILGVCSKVATNFSPLMLENDKWWLFLLNVRFLMHEPAVRFPQQRGGTLYRFVLKV